MGNKATIKMTNYLSFLKKEIILLIMVTNY